MMYLYHHELQCVFLKNKYIYHNQKANTEKVLLSNLQTLKIHHLPTNFLSRKNSRFFTPLVRDQIPESHIIFSCSLLSPSIQIVPRSLSFTV